MCPPTAWHVTKMGALVRGWPTYPNLPYPPRPGACKGTRPAMWQRGLCQMGACAVRYLRTPAYKAKGARTGKRSGKKSALVLLQVLGSSGHSAALCCAVLAPRQYAGGGAATSGRFPHADYLELAWAQAEETPCRIATSHTGKKPGNVRPGSSFPGEAPFVTNPASLPGHFGITQCLSWGLLSAPINACL